MFRKVPAVVQRRSRRRGPAFTFTPPPPQMIAQEPMMPPPVPPSMPIQPPVQNQPPMQNQQFLSNPSPPPGQPLLRGHSSVSNQSSLPAPMASAPTIPPGQVPVPMTPPPQPFTAGPTPQGGQAGYQRQPSQAGTPPPAHVSIEMDGNIVGRFQLNKPTMTVGRLNGSDIQVPNQRVSRLHARILADQGVWVIEDAESVNGIVYQGKRVKRLLLNNGDRIYLAPNVVLQYETM